MRFIVAGLVAWSAVGLAPHPSGVATRVERNGLVRVELNRCGKLNALSESMWQGLGAAASGEGPLLVTSGDAKAFSAGGDVRALAGGPEADVVDFLELEYATLERLREREEPTISVSDGLTFGAGAGVFMACDARVVTEGASLAMPECRIGLCPDAGALAWLTEACEPPVARFLALTGFQLNAHDLVACGLATHFVPAKADQLVPRSAGHGRTKRGERAPARGVALPRRAEFGEERGSRAS